MDQVCDRLNLLECDYFGLSYEDRHDSHNWLEMDKRIGKFLKSKKFDFIYYIIVKMINIYNIPPLGEPWMFNFEMKFYPPDPNQLQEDITRYQLCLQIRNDILNGKYVYMQKIFFFIVTFFNI